MNAIETGCPRPVKLGSLKIGQGTFLPWEVQCDGTKRKNQDIIWRKVESAQRKGLKLFMARLENGVHVQRIS